MNNINQPYRTTTLLILLFLLTACTNSSTTFIPVTPYRESASVIYIYRPASLSNSFVSPELIVNGKKTFKINNNSYTYLLKHKGKYQFKLNLGQRYSGNTELTLEIEPKKIYFIRISTILKFEKNKPYTRRFDIEQVDHSIALTEIKTLSLTNYNNNSKSMPRQVSSKKETINHEKFSIDKTRNPFSR